MPWEHKITSLSFSITKIMQVNGRKDVKINTIKCFIFWDKIILYKVIFRCRFFLHAEKWFWGIIFLTTHWVLHMKINFIILCKLLFLRNINFCIQYKNIISENRINDFFNSFQTHYRKWNNFKSVKLQDTF